MLRIDLAEVRVGPVQTVGELAPDDPLLAEVDPGMTVVAPVRVKGRLSSAGEGKYYWRASLLTVVRAECRRCLEVVEVPVSASLGVIFAREGDVQEGDGCYVIAARAKTLDLAEAVREEVLLALPQYVECSPDCRGLCPKCGANLNDGPCGCAPAGIRGGTRRVLTQPEGKGD